MDVMPRLFSVLRGFWAANFVAFNGDVCRELADQFLVLAQKQGATVPLMLGHLLVGFSLLLTGQIAEGRAHLDRSVALYDPAEHRPLATRFGQDIGVALLSPRSLALWVLGYPEAALTDTELALADARESDPRLRTTLIQLAWLWLRNQPQSALALWFKERVNRNGGRLKKTTIVALARKLLVALWKYVTAGVVIEGAIVKSA